MPLPLFDRIALDRQTSRQLIARPDAASVGSLASGAPSSLEVLDAGSTWAPAWMTVVGNAADLGSTLWALRHAGVKEGNPLYGQNLGRIAATKIIATVPQIILEKTLVDRGHSTAATVLGALSLGWGVSLAAHNIAVVKGVR